MGVDVYVLDFLVGLSSLLKRSLGDTLWLGRQGFHIGPEQRRSAEDVLQRYNSHLSFDDIAGKTHFCESLFVSLGSSSIKSMDISSFEGADIIHDLNTPISEDNYNTFDTIFDGGTLEHVFHLPNALENVRKMLRVGGLFISVNAANNQLGHGFYQFSPELFWSYFRESGDFAVERIMLMPCAGMPNGMDAPDPAVTGRREEIGSTPYPTYLFVAARKIGASETTGTTPQQSDYAAMWKWHEKP
ncbi:class I SAM-dependent methyltransferase [Methylobacterium nodulans]|nr:class I SAM-dependent methyltransferase [Methylobacterium nodulans]